MVNVVGAQKEGRDNLHHYAREEPSARTCVGCGELLTVGVEGKRTLKDGG